MARIDEYLRKILSSRYGKDVRDAIHDSIEEINNVNEANIGTVQAIANTAQGYANNASDSADTAEQAVTDAQAQVTLAQQQVTLATTQAENASDSAEDSEAWAVGKRGGVDVPSTDDTYQNNAKYWQERANYWYQQAQAIAESFSGALRPMGTVTFVDLPPIADAEAGDMYNVSDEFTTTSDFKEGAGHQIPLGSNVYKTNDGKWDVLAGSPVTGIKGDSETTYRRGNVNITKANIGLGNVDNESLGSADISSIGDGSVKGAITQLNTNLATTNSDLGSKSSASAVTGNDAFSKIATLKSTLNDISVPVTVIAKNNIASGGSDAIQYTKIGKLVIVHFQAYETFQANVWKEIALQRGLPTAPAPSITFSTCISGNADAYGTVQVIKQSYSYFTLRFSMSKAGTYVVRGEIIYVTTD